MKKDYFLYLTIVLEGYVVLAVELLAMRQLVPYVGSGTEIVAIVVSAVLLPLAIGYHKGGTAFRRHRHKSIKSGKRIRSVRQILLNNFLQAAIIICVGLSSICLEAFFYIFRDTGCPRVIQTIAYVCVFMVYPIYILGQTVPLVSHYFGRKKLSEATGKILFLSTIGSFLGSLFSTLVLMNTVGVQSTAKITIYMLLALALPLTRWNNWSKIKTIFIIGGLTYVLDGTMLYPMLHKVSDNAYNTIYLLNKKDDDSRIMFINRSSASQISDTHDGRFQYIRQLDNQLIQPALAKNKPLSILAIGAGGFTLGIDDTKNAYTFVDIDSTIKEVAERDFLQRKLTPNKKFIPLSARAFVHQSKETYDLIVVDAYSNAIAVPMEVTTQEFWRETKKLLKPNGVLAVNAVLSANFNNKFALRFDNTFRSVFPHYTRYAMIPELQKHDTPITWDVDETRNTNVLYIYYNRESDQDNVIYTDDKNTYSLDVP